MRIWINSGFLPANITPDQYLELETRTMDAVLDMALASARKKPAPPTPANDDVQPRR